MVPAPTRGKQARHGSMKKGLSEPLTLVVETLQQVKANFYRAGEMGRTERLVYTTVTTTNFLPSVSRDMVDPGILHLSKVKLISFLI